MLETIQDIVENFPTTDRFYPHSVSLASIFHIFILIFCSKKVSHLSSDQLAAMQKENLELKKEKDFLQSVLVKEADDFFKIKLLELENVDQERERLKARILQLEQQLSLRSGTSFDQNLNQDDNQLRIRLNQLQQLPEEVKALKNKANEVLQASGDTDEKEKLLKRISELEKDIENYKLQLKELELLRIERNCCQARLNDLKKVQCNYQDLLEKTRGFETLQAKCASYKQKCEKLSNLEAECLALRENNQKAVLLEVERQNLLKELQECMCCMRSQQEEIEKLGSHIDSLTQNLDQRQVSASKTSKVWQFFSFLG